MINMLTAVFLSSILCSVFAARPDIVDDILPEVKRLGQTAYLNCSVINLQSPAQLQWLKKTSPIGPQKNISSDETVFIDEVVEGKRKYDVVKYGNTNRLMYQLIVRSLTETDAGTYTCQIYLPNQNYKEWPQKLGVLTVQIPPTIKNDSLASITVNEGQNITLLCEAQGNPAPNITWKRADGFPLPNGGFQHRGGIYKVYQINATDRGQFICIADNNVKPPASYTIQLVVTFAPYCTAVQDTVGQAQNRRFHAKLECLVAANPRAEVIWYKENKATREKDQIQDNDKYKLEQQDDQRLKADEKWYTLEIKNVQGNDYGDYYCTGKNEHGENQAQFQLFETTECQGQNCPSVGAIPEIVDDILPEVKKQGQTAYLNCSIIHLLHFIAKVQWIKQTSPTGPPKNISSDETVLIDEVVGGQMKYDVVKYRSNDSDIYQLIIRSLMETDAGNYTCQIYLPNWDYEDWPQTTCVLTVQKTMKCQGQNCPTGKALASYQVSIVTFMFGLTISFSIRYCF
ncbi:lachesin-like isoform X2 [Mytilus edulis]|uniref:lachesin-like isoform X2 n=1 Tax=Mytilus edulis TaxID=6550 RepID=UPI0039F0FB52